MSVIRRLLAAAAPRWVLIVLIAFGSGLSTTVTVLHSDALSPLDEWVYVDYIDKVPTQGMVFKGEPIGHDALDIIACEGVTPYGVMGDPCGSDYDYHHFPFGGVTSADPYPPVFFALTRVVGDLIGLLPGIDELTGWRLVGSVWLVGSLVAFWALLRSWRVHKFAILGLCLAFIGSPLSYWTYTYVSTDAPAFLIGTLLLLLATRYLRGEIRGWGMVAVAIVGATFKITNLLGVGMVALVLLIAAITRAREAGWSFRGTPVRLAATAGAALLGGIVVQVGWLTISRATAVSTEGAYQTGVTQPLTVQELLSQVVNFLPSTIVSNVPVAGGTGWVFPLPGYAIVPLTWLCIAGVLGALLRLRRVATERAAVIVGVAIAAALAGPALALAMQVFLSSYFPLPSRYGATLLPGFLLLAGILLHNRWMSVLIGVYGVGLAAAQVYGSYLLGRG